MDSPILIIRYSSLGDIAQSLFAVEHLHLKFPSRPVHFLTKSEFADLAVRHPHINQVHSFDKKSGLWGLVKLSLSLRKHNFSIVYDAHNNLRSLLTRLLLFTFSTQFIVRSKNRIKRFLFFKLRKPVFPKPFIGAQSFVEPLNKIGITYSPNLRLALRLDDVHLKATSSQLADAVVIAPSAAWEMKRWPIEHWIKLVKLVPSPVVILGGPKDTLCAEIAASCPDKTTNLAGQLNWTETCKTIALAKALVAGDTGALHLADLMGTPCLALMGPTAFGFPARKKSKIMVTDLPCQPCTKDGRGGCVNPVYKKCLIELTPDKVYQELNRMILDS